MRIYIMTDLEGISGVVGIEYMDRELPFYQDARELLMGDVNAAIAGCFDGGATEVVIRDGHGGGNNFITDRLDRRAALDRKSDIWTASLDTSFDATMFVGVHAMAGTLNGFLDHTQNSRMWWRYTINGRLCGEIAQWATMASHFKVPVAYISGDQAGCQEAADLLPGVVTTAVKKGVGRNRAVGVHPDLAHEAIRHDAARAIIDGKKRLPKLIRWNRPMTARLTFYRSDMADARCTANGRLKRIDARTVEKKANSLLDIMI